MDEQTQVEQWLKIATDNKITVNNSWSVQLIDYFYQLHRHQATEVNFTKASCTLDGCVKVYSTRVDAVFTETGRLLSGLVQNKDVDESVDEQEEGELPKVKKRKKLASTIEGNKEALTLKKFDLDYKIDPLFKKICADFDETGSSGLLLNHLKVNGVCKLTFSSYDRIVDGYEELVQLNDKVRFTEQFSPATFIAPSLAAFRYDREVSFDQLMREEFMPSLVDELEDYADEQFDYSPLVEEVCEEPVQDDVELNRLSVIHAGTSDALTYFDEVTEKQIESKRMLRSGKSSVELSEVSKSAPVKTPRKKQPEVNISFVQVVQTKIKQFNPDVNNTTVNKVDYGREHIARNKLHVEFDDFQMYSLFLKPLVDARQYCVKQVEDAFEGDEVDQIDFEMYDAPQNQFTHDQQPPVEDDVREIQVYQQSSMSANASALNYSKKAKRVDVKLLKQHIWNYMARGQDRFEGSRSLTDIHNAVQRIYPPNVAKEITLPYYIICLLHLANEKVLEVESVAGLKQLFILCE